MSQNDNESPVLTISQLCQRWHCTRNTIMLMVRRGDFEVFRIGKRWWRVRLAEVERYERTSLKVPCLSA